MRARIVLLAAAGAGNSEIAGRLGICEDTARKWRRRYGEKGLGGLCEPPRRVRGLSLLDERPGRGRGGDRSGPVRPRPG
ncbi:helix-turn-helix domain-containing protein [Streptomyces sp. NPDC048362]|uniref:helix-turn-helix domain-containing protein n=1 Tax=Streptomyces sp. NPDC048362 TaxID=3365539 RepID=UPI0037176A7D